jgi:4-diphosphocytidyl-2-C-methyl-D-erythritol kinase
VLSGKGDVKAVKYRAYAKINLALSILGKRTDGYHEIGTLMVPVSLADLVSVEVTTQGLEVYCPGLPGLPQAHNLAYKAAASLVSGEFGTPGLAISIDKAIPPGKGLGGGSSDAAAVLLAIRDLWKHLNKPDLTALVQTAAGIGSDIPFFIGANAKPPVWEGALCTSKGERVYPVRGGSFWVLLVLPDIEISTRLAYSKWDDMHPEAPTFATPLDFAGALAVDSRLRDAAEAFSSNDPERLGRCIFNDFEKSVYPSYPELSIIKEDLLLSGALGAALTGSGSAVYGICGSRGHASEVRERFLELSGGLPANQVVIARTGVNIE